MNKALVGITAATGLALAITTMVGHGQNVASGQVFAEPPVPPRSVPQNLATKINAPFTVAAVGDVMVNAPALRLPIRRSREPFRSFAMPTSASATWKAISAISNTSTARCAA